MPHSPGLTRFRTSVQAGVDIIRAMKRRITNLAVPEFVLPHHTGKHTIPLLAEDEPRPRRWLDQEGKAFVEYTNWRGDRVQYPDTIGSMSKA
jgi:lysine 2,3-aminomutase